MNINKYTEKAREAVASAIELARRGNNPQLEPEHLLVALVEQREGIVPGLLRKMNADPAQVANSARELLSRIPSAYGGSEPGLSPRLNKVTAAAESVPGTDPDRASFTVALETAREQVTSARGIGLAGQREQPPQREETNQLRGWSGAGFRTSPV